MKRPDDDVLEMIDQLDRLIEKNAGLPIASRLMHYLDALNWAAGKSKDLITPDGMPKT